MFRARHCCGKLASAGSLDLNPEIAAGKDPPGMVARQRLFAVKPVLVRTNTSRFPLRETSFYAEQVAAMGQERHGEGSGSDGH